MPSDLEFGKCQLNGSQWLYTKNFWTCCDFGQVPFSCLFLSFDKGKKGKSLRGTSTNGEKSSKFRAHKAITHGTMNIWDLDLHRKVRDQVVFHGYFLDTPKKYQKISWFLEISIYQVYIPWYPHIFSIVIYIGLLSSTSSKLIGPSDSIILHRGAKQKTHLEAMSCADVSRSRACAGAAGRRWENPMKLIGILQLYIYNDLYIYNYLYPIEISHCWDIISILYKFCWTIHEVKIATGPNWGQPVDRVLLVCCLRLEQRPFRQAFCAAKARETTWRVGGKLMETSKIKHHPVVKSKFAHWKLAFS